MDTFRLNPDAVRRALPDDRTQDAERDESERLVERVREAEERVREAEERGAPRDDRAGR